mgnify:CR=1 FL=1
MFELDNFFSFQKKFRIKKESHPFFLIVFPVFILFLVFIISLTVFGFNRNIGVVAEYSSVLGGESTMKGIRIHIDKKNVFLNRKAFFDFTQDGQREEFKKSLEKVVRRKISQAATSRMLIEGSFKAVVSFSQETNFRDTSSVLNDLASCGVEQYAFEVNELRKI